MRSIKGNRSVLPSKLTVDCKKFQQQFLLFVMLVIYCTCTSQHATKTERIIFDSQFGSNNNSFELFSILSDGNDLVQHTFDAVPRRANTSGQYSPDGKYVVFGTYKYGGYKVAIANSDFTQQRKLSKGPHYTYVGSWSPDSKHLVYSKVDTKSAPYFQGDMEIFIMAIDGSKDVNISNSKGADFSPKWSSDGQRILFCSDRNGNSDIYTIDINGQNLSNLTNTPDIDEFAPSWSPDNKHIAFHAMQNTENIKYIDLYVMEVKAAKRRNITKNETAKRNAFVPYYKGASPIFYQTTWSPDGRKIAFSSKRSSKNFEIYSINTDGTGLRQLTNNGVDNVFPFWYTN